MKKDKTKEEEKDGGEREKEGFFVLGEALGATAEFEVFGLGALGFFYCGSSGFFWRLFVRCTGRESYCCGFYTRFSSCSGCFFSLCSIVVFSLLFLAVCHTLFPYRRRFFVKDVEDGIIFMIDRIITKADST